MSQQRDSTNRKHLLSFLSALKIRFIINQALNNFLEQAKALNKIDPNAIPKAYNLMGIFHWKEVRVCYLTTEY